MLERLMERCLTAKAVITESIQLISPHPLPPKYRQFLLSAIAECSWIAVQLQTEPNALAAAQNFPLSMKGRSLLLQQHIIRRRSAYRANDSSASIVAQGERERESASDSALSLPSHFVMQSQI
jgi:hypothetical protein